MIAEHLIGDTTITLHREISNEVTETIHVCCKLQLMLTKLHREISNEVTETSTSGTSTWQWPVPLLHREISNEVTETSSRPRRAIPASLSLHREISNEVTETRGQRLLDELDRVAELHREISNEVTETPARAHLRGHCHLFIAPRDLE